MDELQELNRKRAWVLSATALEFRDCSIALRHSVDRRFSTSSNIAEQMCTIRPNIQQ